MCKLDIVRLSDSGVVSPCDYIGALRSIRHVNKEPGPHTAVQNPATNQSNPGLLTTAFKRMNCLEDVPFKIPMGSLEEPLEEFRPVTAPEIHIPDHHQILQETAYDFTMENWVLSRLPKPPVNHRGPSAHMSSTSQALPCCPPYWMMFRSPQESRLSRGRSSEFREMGPRPRSLSLSAADSRPPYIHRTVKFLLADSERDCGGYSEDDEGSSTEEDNFSRKRGEQSKGSRSKAPFSRLKEIQQNPPHHLTAQTSPRSVSSHRKSKSASHEPQNVPPPPNREQSRVGSPLSYSQRVSKKRQSVPNSSGRRNQRLPTSRAFLQPRPSSAGTLPSSRNPRSTGQALRPRSSHGRASTYDSSKELLSALNQDERDLLEAITEKGYSLHTAIIALQKTGHRKPEQILSYLMACDRLCGQGYDKTQVEEALEMFQSCESKAAEFLHLLAQFNEMGFQQNAIKEVLLVHENHRERALEELMTRVA